MPMAASRPMAGSRRQCRCRTGKGGGYDTQKHYCENLVAGAHGLILDVPKNEMVYAPALLKRLEKPSKHYELMRTILLEEFCIVPKRDSDPLLAYPGLAPWAKICRRSAAGVCCWCLSRFELDVGQPEPSGHDEGRRARAPAPHPPIPHRPSLVVPFTRS
jgi:hypothetical protein